MFISTHSQASFAVSRRRKKCSCRGLPAIGSLFGVLDDLSQLSSGRCGSRRPHRSLARADLNSYATAPRVRVCMKWHRWPINRDHDTHQKGDNWRAAAAHAQSKPGRGQSRGARLVCDRQARARPEFGLPMNSTTLVHIICRACYDLGDAG